MTITINRLPGYGDPVVLDLETLAGADLRRAVLYGAALSGAVLTRADLSGADLYRANLRGADLYVANLSGSNLRGADLTRADLTGSNLRGSDLTGSNLRGSDLYRADLRGAKIYDDALAFLITRIGRSDGYEFIAFRLTDGSVKIMAGCRWLTPDEYRAHVAAEYPDTDKGRETLDIIEFIERMTT